MNPAIQYDEFRFGPEAENKRTKNQRPQDKVEGIESKKASTCGIIVAEFGCCVAAEFLF
jgi:hypothetical protein